LWYEYQFRYAGTTIIYLFFLLTLAVAQIIIAITWKVVDKKFAIVSYFLGFLLIFIFATLFVI